MFFALFLVSMVSAASLSYDNVVEPSSINHDDGSFIVTFDLINAGVEDTIDWSTSLTEGDATFTFSSNTVANGVINGPVTKEITATGTFDAHQSGAIEGSFTADPSGAGSDLTIPFSVTIEDSAELLVSDETIPTGETSTELTLTNNGNTPLTNILLTASDDFDVTFSDDGFSLLAGAEETITVSVSEDDLDDFDLGLNSITITATSGSFTGEGQVQIENNNICSATQGSLEVSISDIESVTEFGDDDKWYLFNEINIEVEIENTNNDEKIKDVKLEWGIYDESSNEWIIELDEEDEFDLKDDDEEIVIINFVLSEKELDVDFEDLSGGDYTLYVRAIGDEQEDPEFEVCDFDSDTIEIVVDSDFVIVEDLEMPETVQCGENLEINAELWNIGEDEQDDVLLLVRNSELGISERITVGDIKDFDNEKLTFIIPIPEDAEEGFYNLIFELFDEDNENFENEDDDKSNFVKQIELSGSCAPLSSVDISASLESDSVAGKEMDVEVTLTNRGDETTTYEILINDYDLWASLESVDPESVSLAPGESKKVMITLKPNKDVEGDREFLVQILYNGNINEQRINVPVEPSQGFSLTGSAIGENLKENWFIWLIGALNVILVILIILVAVRVARR